jgi:hypothetical protein
MPSAFSDQPDQTRRSVEFPGHAATVLTLLGLFGSTTIDPTRREFIGAMIVASAAGIWTRSGSTPADEKANAAASLDVPLVVNGRAVRLSVEPRVTLVGGIVYGLAMALHEHTAIDPTSGRYLNADLSEYLVPVNADIPPIDVILVDEHDSQVDPIGVKGIGEIGTTGVAAAVANAVYHATGVRVRDLPITLDKVLKLSA